MSVRYKANKSADRESQFSELRRSQKGRKKIDKNLSDSFIIQTTYSKRLKSCIPIPQSSWGIKVGMRPIVSCKKSDLWLYLTGLLQQFIKTNKSNFNCKEQCSFCTFLSRYQSSFFSTFSFLDLSWAAEHQFNFQKNQSMFVWSLTYRWVVSDRLSSSKRSEEDPHQLVSYSMSIVKDNFKDQSSVAVVFIQKRLFRRFFDKRRDTNDQTFICFIYFSRNPTRVVERNLESIGDINHRKIALFPHQRWFHNCPPRFCPCHGLDSQKAHYSWLVVCRPPAGWSFPRLFPNF